MCFSGTSEVSNFLCLLTITLNIIFLSVNIFLMERHPPTAKGALPREWGARGVKSYVLLLYEYLRLSPSYEVARQIRMDGLPLQEGRKRYIQMHEQEAGERSSKDRRLELNDQFKSLLMTFDEFGDVSRDPFAQWWQQRGLAIYGAVHVQPRARLITQLAQGPVDDTAMCLAVKEFNAGPRAQEGQPESLMVSIPLGLKRLTVLRQIARLVEQADVPVPPRTQSSRREMSGLRFRPKPLLMGIRLLMYRALNPNWSLWQLGVMANVSPTHTPGLEIDDKKKGSTKDQRILLTILTSRALRRAKMVAENAAHGLFPSSSTRALPVYDFDDLYRRIRIARPNIRPKPLSMKLKQGAKPSKQG
jgi:hypothetical protein